MTYDYMRHAVAEGADLLDQTYPGWFNDVDLTILDMNSAGNCMLGQVLGSYSQGVQLLDLAKKDPASYGFHLNLDDLAEANIAEEFDELTAAWANVIESRRHMYRDS